MTSFMKNLKPDCFEDIVAGIALYRPGPMASIPTYIDNKKNPGHVQYIHESLQPILGVTYGCMVYQEQVMQIVRDLGGYSYGRSDLVRRAMSKKKMDVMLEEKEYFINGKTDENGNVEIPGCVRNGVPRQAAEEIFNQMISFAEYAFNKSHAAAYAVLAYETSYLKTHYPVEFMAALMTSVMSDTKAMSMYIRNCKEMGIEVLPPDVNESGKKFTVVYDPDDIEKKHGHIRFGLLGIKNMGEGPSDAIIEAREQKGKPTDIFRFIENLDIHRVNKKAVESLIKAGALDCLNKNRAAHFGIYESVIDSAQNAAKHNITGQMSLFQTNAEALDESVKHKLPDVKNFPPEELLAQEKEVLGVYLTAHPLDEYADVISRNVSVTTKDLAEVLAAEEEGYTGNITDGMKAVMAGIITSKKNLITKNGKMMSFVEMEDMFGAVEVVVFPNVYERCSSLIEEDKIVAVGGHINFKEGEMPKLLADSVTDIRQAAETTPESPAPEQAERQTVQPAQQPEGLIKIRLPEGDGIHSIDGQNRRNLEAISAVLKKYPGKHQAIIYYPQGGSRRTGPDLWVTPDDAFAREIENIVGKENYKA